VEGGVGLPTMHRESSVVKFFVAIARLGSARLSPIRSDSLRLAPTRSDSLRLAPTRSGVIPPPFLRSTLLRDSIRNPLDHPRVFPRSVLIYGRRA